MTPSEIARAMSAYIREHGFDPEYHVGKGCGCFFHASAEVMPTFNNERFVALMAIERIIGTNWFGATGLERAGWTEGCTEDAAAACDIAADLLA